ncbi:hypothetical protein GLOTRDRAFT_131378 [Gloeophyllum trabeum ATCC 11539]|uniref:Uncharacterized protein n=1 Tax=Gloeophyllum trabeum (strain ATCC 11539 / FP-39264 / Madison 617) TaxID=670483 RepID=S7PZK7_GLOTA|nr:uncharacterized protein GLOTRDRAFT_131378 [Gloeophyllum trabeum ATCC 11539]EPQ53096.1 hypothetical protein GLOTRDRAFT_131378 [Gloeophyllum trabeum ATCC 11539]
MSPLADTPMVDAEAAPVDAPELVSSPPKASSGDATAMCHSRTEEERRLLNGEAAPTSRFATFFKQPSSEARKITNQKNDLEDQVRRIESKPTMDGTTLSTPSIQSKHAAVTDIPAFKCKGLVAPLTPKEWFRMFHEIHSMPEHETSKPDPRISFAALNAFEMLKQAFATNTMAGVYGGSAAVDDDYCSTVVPDERSSEDSSSTPTPPDGELNSICSPTGPSPRPASSPSTLPSRLRNI